MRADPRDSGFFPAGALVMLFLRHRSTLLIHSILQLCGAACAIAGMGLGIYIAETMSLLAITHAILGLVATCGLVAWQPLSGVVSHQLFRTRRWSLQPYMAAAHRAVGRALVLIGGFNGTLGLMIAGNSRAGLIAYAVLFSVIYAAWYLGIVVRGAVKEVARLKEGTVVGNERLHEGSMGEDGEEVKPV